MREFNRTKYLVTDSTLHSTVKCKDNFSCLSGNNTCLCYVEDCSNGDVHFVRPENNWEICEYRMTFGYSYTCNCPVRKELYNTYKI